MSDQRASKHPKHVSHRYNSPPRPYYIKHTLSLLISAFILAAAQQCQALTSQVQMSNKENSSVNSLQSEMKQMFQDMMSQLGTLSSVLAKSKDKPPSAASKKAGRSKADDVSDREASEPSEETDKGRKRIFEVSEPTQAFLQSAFCRVSLLTTKQGEREQNILVCRKEMRPDAQN